MSKNATTVLDERGCVRPEVGLRIAFFVDCDEFQGRIVELCEHGLFVRIDLAQAEHSDQPKVGDLYGLAYDRIMYPVLAGDSCDGEAEHEATFEAA